jgi:hypothetical protein
LRKAGANSNGAKISTIGGQYSVDSASLSYGGDSTIDQPKTEFLESCIQFQGSSNIGRKWQLILVSRARIENIRDEFSHGCTVLSEEVVNLGENKPRHDNDAR